MTVAKRLNLLIACSVLGLLLVAVQGMYQTHLVFTSALKQIANIVSIIDDIAAQTNLLALNVAMKVARAGKHGEGFAVVAAEVRKLAEKADKLLNEIVPNIRKSTDRLQEITAARKEQFSGVGRINSALSQLHTATQKNASSLEELAVTAIGLAKVRRVISQHVGRTWVEGKVDDGATFYVSLPRSSTNESARGSR
jgi:methyl-accepting chemotaxis protein